MFDFDLNEPPLNDYHEPDGGPCQLGVRVPRFRFELSHQLPGLPAPNVEDETSPDGVVCFLTTHDKVFLNADRAFYPELEGGPIPLAQGGQHTATVGPTRQRLQSPVSRPTDVEKLHDDDVPANPMAQGDQPGIHHVPVAPIEQNLQPRGSTPPGPIDIVELDSDDEDDDDADDDEDDDEADDGDDDEEEDDDDDDDGDDYSIDSYEGDDVTAGDGHVIISQASGPQRTLGRAPLTDSESEEISDNDSEPERGPTNPLAQGGPSGMHLPFAPVEQPLQQQGPPPPWPVDLVELDSSDEEADEDDDDEEADEDDDDEEADEGDDDEEADEDDDDDEEADEDDDDVSISSLIPSSSRPTQYRSLRMNATPVPFADNHQGNKRRRVDSQPPVNIRDFNVHSVGTSSSMTKPVAPPPPPPPPAPVPNVICSICLGPLVDPMSPRCGHVFCERCIKRAIAVQPRCPLCRNKVSYRELHHVYFSTGN